MRTYFPEGRGLSRFTQGADVSIPLRSRGARLALILLAAIPGVLLGFQAARMALAARLGSRLDVAGLRRAIALDPGNAGYEHQLGLIDAYSFGPANFPEAVKHLRRATELNPRKAQYWSDLAEVCDSTGDAACSHQAVERALQLSPATPRFEWKAANHFLREGRVDEALRHFRRLLALDDSYAQPVFQVCLRVTRSPQTILEAVIPAGRHPRLQMAYLDFVSAQGDIDFANSLWAKISSDGVACRFEDVRPYVENLFASGHLRRAAAVWRQLERAGVIPGFAEDRAANLVYNGRFSHTPLDAGFDWQMHNAPYVETDFHDPSAFRGSRCLRVDYAAGGNLESEPVCEFVPVVPGRAYRLRAEVRSENITSASGPRLRVTDPECTACLNAATGTTVGTTRWHPVALDFAAGAHTRVVRLSVWRARSRTFPMEISGSFWLDDVSITPLKSAPKETASAD
ncbi:MAG: tetratricopeptide repeat protein [Terriglobia bacterium]